MMMKIGSALIAIYACVVLAAWLGQRRLIYVPNSTRHAPSAAGLANAVERSLATPDGERLVAWHVRPAPGQPTLLYFHGNAGGLVNRAARAGRYASLGFGILMPSYRGYSGSTGAASEANNLADARLAYDLLRQEGVAVRDIVLYGESLGSGVAVQLAAEKPVAGVVLDAPYTSMIDMAVRRFPILPVRPLLSDRYESIEHIKRVSAPLLVLHGANDELIPVAMGQALHQAANEPKRIVIFPAGRHTDLDDHGAVDAVKTWVAGLR